MFYTLILSALIQGCDSATVLSGGKLSSEPPSEEPRFQSALHATEMWQDCAFENGHCSFTGTKAVRFGINSSWSDPAIYDSGSAGGVTCDVNVADVAGDPAQGFSKKCQISDVEGNNFATRGVLGEWSGINQWPLVGVHASLLPSGKVLTHNATNDDLWPKYSPLTQLWDPVTNNFSSVDSRESTNGSELFCAGFTHLPDGSLLTSGNQPNVRSSYDRNVNRFNYFTESWSREEDSEYYRYYPSMATMPSGDLVSFAGTSEAAPFEQILFDGSWRALNGMTLSQNFNYYPWGQAAPDGSFFYAGPDPAMRTVDTSGAGSMLELGNRDNLNRNFGSYAMYEPGKILVAGGAQPASDLALIIDINNSTPVVTETGSMNFPRRHHDLTILADGSVLATGGYNNHNFTQTLNDDSIYEAELWNPDTGTWSTMASAQRQRNYHSTGILIPDGRVLVAGNGNPNYKIGNQFNAELYSPPYLFTLGTGSFATKTNVSGSIECNNASFGDPVRGVVKTCAYLPMDGTADTVFCANENENCVLPASGTATVFFGANGQFEVKTGQSGTLECNNSTFGDPIRGVAKSCGYISENDLDTINSVSNAQSCASENQVCDLPSGSFSTVYYGAQGKFAIKTGQAGPIDCDNATFGDPIEKVTKSCFFNPESSNVSNLPGLPNNAQHCSTEGGVCTTPGPATVYYGAANVFIEKYDVNGAVDCNNRTFGDPIRGILKSCSYVLDSEQAVPTVGTSVNGIATRLPAGAQNCAAEDETCSLPGVGPYIVYYGASDLAADLGNLAPRPVIEYTPDSLGYNKEFILRTGDVQSIRKVHLIKLGSVTHSTNQGQRLIPLNFTVSGSNLAVDGPADSKVAPPGYYMLFIVNDDGVPSEAKMIYVQQNTVVALISRASGNAIGISPGSDHSGTTVQMQGDAAEPNVRQSWEMIPTDSGYFKFVSRANGFVLTAGGGATVTGSRDISSANQQWSLEQSELGYYVLKARYNGQGIHIAGASNAEGAPLFQQSLAASVPEHAEWILLPVGHQRIVTVESGKSLQVRGKSAQAGAGIEIATHNGDTHQSFKFVPNSDGYLSLIAAHSGMAVGVENDSIDAVTNLEQQSPTTSQSQQWLVLPQSDGSFMLKVRHSQQFMNVLYHLLSNGSSVGQYINNGGKPNQFWRLSPAVSLDPHQRNASGRAIAAGYVTSEGWLKWVAASNTTGNAVEDLEAVKISVKGISESLGITYRTRPVNSGNWGAWVNDSEQSGTPGVQQGIELFQAKLTEERNACEISYRSFISGAGWQAWVQENETSGGTGVAISGLQVKVECTAPDLVFQFED